MRVTKQSGFGNTTAMFGITYRKLATSLLVYGAGVGLFVTPLFRWNWAAIIGYFVLASILVGETPTKRSMFTNIYGVVFKKPMKMVVSKMATVNTFGHGVREVELVPEIDVPAVRLMTGQYALVYVVTSDLNRWSETKDFEDQATDLKQLFNVMEGSEGIDIVVKEDSDAGMMRLKEILDEREQPIDEEVDKDLYYMSARRKGLLVAAATSDVGRSVQQYVILKVKPKNVKRTTTALKKATRLIRPAANPLDVIMSTMGLEGGTLLNADDYAGKNKQKRAKSKTGTQGGRERTKKKKR